MGDRRDHLDHFALVGIYLYYASIKGSQVDKFLEEANLAENIADSFAQTDLMFEDIEGQDPNADQEVLAAADQAFSPHYHQGTDALLVELQKLVDFLGDGAIGGEHYFAGLGAVG